LTVKYGIYLVFIGFDERVENIFMRRFVEMETFGDEIEDVCNRFGF